MRLDKEKEKRIYNFSKKRKKKTNKKGRRGEGEKNKSGRVGYALNEQTWTIEEKK